MEQQINLWPQDLTASKLGVAKVTLAAWRRKMTGPPWVKIGKRVYYRPTDVNEWIDRATVRPNQ